MIQPATSRTKRRDAERAGWQVAPAAAFSGPRQTFTPLFPLPTIEAMSWGRRLCPVCLGDLYDDKEAMEQELAANVAKTKQDYATTVDEARKQKMYTTSELNIRWDGAKDLTKLSDAEKRAMIEMGPVYHDAYCALSKRREFNRGEDKIVIFTTVIPNAIAVGTTKTSVTKYWTGFGILEGDSKGFRSRIVSPSQLEALGERGFELVPTNLLELKNFRDIRVYAV